ncbi:MAG: hypothetical protein M1822_008006 [Bathelium mastoideum]|nr:MAG: hypothetical protein M1822_008006 [Bathelium mastoideum]
MINALNHRVNTLGWRQVKASLIDSHDLTFHDNTFTTAMSSINITTYNSPLKCPQEMYRTLKPGGRAVITIWKRFGITNMIHAPQRLVREDSEPMRVPKSEFMQEGCLRNLVKQAGFEKVSAEAQSILCEGAEIDGLRDFMLGVFTRSVR